LESGDRFTEGYATYEVGIFGMNAIFGDMYQHWNVQYDKANKIFGPGPSATITRTAINMQHTELYRQGMWRTKKGNLEGGEDFLVLVNYGIRNGKRRMFTYALLDDKFRFSETSPRFMKDFMSKHATHANALPEVRYAGEFHIRQSNSYPPRYTLVLDNNSGTYSPDKNLLPKLRQLFQINFPGLLVEALDYKDPLLEKYKSEMQLNISILTQDAQYFPTEFHDDPFAPLPNATQFSEVLNLPTPVHLSGGPVLALATDSQGGIFGTSGPFAAQSIALPDDVGPMINPNRMVQQPMVGLPDPYAKQQPLMNPGLQQPVNSTQQGSIMVPPDFIPNVVVCSPNIYPPPPGTQFNPMPPNAQPYPQFNR